jgi:hypothetical protein
VTNFENDMTSYHTKTYELFTIENPDVAITEQRVADQHRTIEVRGLLATAIKEEIKMQVGEECRIN